MADSVFMGRGDVVGPASATNGNVALFDGTTGKLIKDGGAPTGGTVTSVSVVTANGVSGTVATATTTPAITLTLGAITPTSSTIGTTTTAGTAIITEDAVMGGGASTDNFLNVTGTLPTTLVAAAHAVNLAITSAGSSAQNQSSFRLSLAAGYTGASSTFAANTTNAAAGTGTASWTAGASNYSLFGNTTGTTAGHNVGVLGSASVSSALNIGVGGRAVLSTNSAALNIGMFGIALSATTNVGGFFGLTNVAPTLGSSAALIADNAAVAADIFVARDNGTAVFTIADGGNVTGTGSFIFPTWAPAGGTAAVTGAFTGSSAGTFGGSVTAGSLATGSVRVIMGSISSGVPGLNFVRADDTFDRLYAGVVGTYVFADAADTAGVTLVRGTNTAAFKNFDGTTDGSTVTANAFTATGTIRANTAFNLNGATGATGSANATNTLTIVGGIITAIS